jgi:hypothetical protein
MKQTVEEAAKENILFNHRTVDRTLFGKDLAKFGEMNFVQGAEWQSKQSPWISVNERLPKDFKPKLILLKNRKVRTAILDSDYHPHNNEFEITYFWHDRETNESFALEDVVAWMSIPSFDEILEENRDVLERIKEKGD